MPFASMGADRRGKCLGNNEDESRSCWRDERRREPNGGRETRLTFQFLTHANSSGEVRSSSSPCEEMGGWDLSACAQACHAVPVVLYWCSHLPALPPKSVCVGAQSGGVHSIRFAEHELNMNANEESHGPLAICICLSFQVRRTKESLATREADAAFVQCPVLGYFKPNAYKYSESRISRQHLSQQLIKGRLAPQVLKRIGLACRQYIDDAVRATSPRTRLFLLGTTPLPPWARQLGGQHIEARIFASINAALGLRCDRQIDGKFALHSQHGVMAIDRYAIVGPRKVDEVHPFFNAQFAIVQLMLNHLC